MADTKPLIRYRILDILEAEKNRNRKPEDDPTSYVAEEVIQSLLRRIGYPLLLTEVRGHLYYLKDAGYVKCHDTRVGDAHYFTWRITKRGTDVLDELTGDPGVRRA